MAIGTALPDGAGTFTNVNRDQVNSNFAATALALGSGATTGTGANVLATSPTITSPTLVTPTLSGATSVTGALAPAAGIVPVSTAKHFYAGGANPATSTSGTDTAGINGQVFISEIFIPANFTATGISFLIGSVGGTDKAIVMLFDSAGVLLANSAVAGVTVSTTATMQRLPFTATYAITGPGKYFIGVQYNGNTAKLRTQAFGDVDVASISQVFGTPVAIAAPSTFTASVGPIAMIY